jgi:hypothetical protein
MIVKEITVEVKRSKNYNTWTAGETITIEPTDDVEAIRKERIKKLMVVLDEVSS